MGTYECGCSTYRLNTSWLRLNWCWVVRIILACIGALVPLIMYFLPCENQIFVVVNYRPLDLYIILDGSSSMGFDENSNLDPDQEAWNDAKLSAAFMIDAFASVGFANFQVAALQFSNQGSQEVISSLTTDVESVEELITAQELNGGSTFLAPALSLARTELLENGFNSSGINMTTAQLVIIITDGENQDQPNSLTQSNLLKDDGIFIKGIMVRSYSIANLFEISSCDEFSVDYYLNCTFFTLESSFDNLKEKAEEIAIDLSTSLAQSNVENRCVKAEFLVFLVLLLPFSCVCLFPYIKKMKKKEVRRISTYPVAKNLVKIPPPPPPVAMVQVEPPKLPDQPTPAKKDPRFKWQIKAHDQYLWNLGGGGAAPLKVDFGAKAPPSAPRDPLGRKEKVALETWEDEEGYLVAEVDRVVTFEKYTEEKVAMVLEVLGLKQTLKKWCCMCCCCCRVKSSASTQTTLPNAPVVNEEFGNRAKAGSLSMRPITSKMKMSETWSSQPRAAKPTTQTKRLPPKPRSGPPKPRFAPPKPRVAPLRPY